MGSRCILLGQVVRFLHGLRLLDVVKADGTLLSSWASLPPPAILHPLGSPHSYGYLGIIKPN